MNLDPIATIGAGVINVTMVTIGGNKGIQQESETTTLVNIAELPKMITARNLTYTIRNHS